MFHGKQNDAQQKCRHPLVVLNDLALFRQAMHNHVQATVHMVALAGTWLLTVVVVVYLCPRTNFAADSSHQQG